LHQRPQLGVRTRSLRFDIHSDLTSFTGADLRRRVEPGALVLAVAQSAGDPGHAVEVVLAGETRFVGHTRIMAASVEVCP